MKKFINKFILFSLPVILSPIIFVFYFGFPPPRLSNSLSFNAKIEYIKNFHLNRDINVLSVGSSMTLNNVHTKTIKKYFGNNYLNISSFGQNIKEDYLLIKLFCKYYSPRHIIISCGYMDFNDDYKEINYDMVEGYLFHNSFKAYKNYSFRYLLEESIRYFSSKNDTLSYSSLLYDDCGGVNFKRNNFDIDTSRWQGRSIVNFNFDEIQYQYLDSISNFCKINNINLVLTESPFRNGYYSSLQENTFNILNEHENKIQKIMDRDNHLYIKTEHKSWPDKLFVDYSHLNRKGSEMYTEYFINKINRYTMHNVVYN